MFCSNLFIHCIYYSPFTYLAFEPWPAISSATATALRRLPRTPPSVLPRPLAISVRTNCERPLTCPDSPPRCPPAACVPHQRFSSASRLKVRTVRRMQWIGQLNSGWRTSTSTRQRWRRWQPQRSTRTSRMNSVPSSNGFRVLSEAERTAALYALLQQTTPGADSILHPGVAADVPGPPYVGASFPG